MNPLRPIKDLTDAVVMPFKALFVVGLCALINWMTFSGQWWVQWVALGMGIAVVVALARAARTLLVLGLVWFVGRAVYRRYGDRARQAFDAWVARKQPDAATMMDLLRKPPAGAPEAAVH